MTQFATLDDQGEKHVCDISALPAWDAAKLLPKIEDCIQGDWLDQTLDAALITLQGEDDEKLSDEEAMKLVLAQAANRIVASGDVELFGTLLSTCVRDGVPMKGPVPSVAFSGNMGELERVIAAVLEVSYLGFFAGRVAPLRHWGRRAGNVIRGLFPEILETLSSTLKGNGSSGKPGMPLNAVKNLKALGMPGR